MAGTYGAGRIVCLLGVAWGEPGPGETPFWAWDDWGDLFRETCFWALKNPAEVTPEPCNEHNRQTPGHVDLPDSVIGARPQRLVQRLQAVQVDFIIPGAERACSGFPDFLIQCPASTPV